jgi:HD-like signal output (HDOD) protein
MAGWLSRLFSSQPAPAKAKSQQILAATPEVTSPAPVMPPPNVPAPHVGMLNRVSWMQSDNLNANWMNCLFEGNDESDLFANQLEKEILVALEKIVHAKQPGADMVRRMPGVVPQLLQSLRTENFSGAELARQISHDVVLVAAVIRIANSSLYRSDEPITSIEHAVLVLGQTGLRQLITSVAFKPIIDLKSGHFTKTLAPKIWQQSEYCAVANRILAAGGPIVPFDAFLAGLIQNVGLIVSLRFIDQLSDHKQRIGSFSFCNSLVAYGRRISISIIRDWNFPEAVVTAIDEQGNINREIEISSLGLLLETGDYLSKLNVLIEHNRLKADDPYLTKGLSDRALSCLHELNELNAPPAG